jgi:hypothetical protein
VGVGAGAGAGAGVGAAAARPAGALVWGLGGAVVPPLVVVVAVVGGRWVVALEGAVAGVVAVAGTGTGVMSPGGGDGGGTVAPGGARRGVGPVVCFPALVET